MVSTRRIKISLEADPLRHTSDIPVKKHFFSFGLGPHRAKFRCVDHFSSCSVMLVIEFVLLNAKHAPQLGELLSLLTPKLRFLIKVSAFLTFRKRFEDILSIFHCPQFIVCWLLILHSIINLFGLAKMLFACYNKLDLKKLKLEQHLGHLKLNIKSIISP